MLSIHPIAQERKAETAKSARNSYTIKSYNHEKTINTPLTLTTEIAWSAEKSQFVATVSYGADKTILNTYDLGKSYSLDKLVFSMDGGSQKVSNLKIITNTIPEPTTATLSLLALAGLAARRRRK